MYKCIRRACLLFTPLLHATTTPSPSLSLSLSSLSKAIVKIVKRHKKPRSLMKNTMEERKEGPTTTSP
jgi:hypothetical protein